MALYMVSTTSKFVKTDSTDFFDNLVHPPIGAIVQTNGGSESIMIAGKIKSTLEYFT